jgi:hypothetical protein
MQRVLFVLAMLVSMTVGATASASQIATNQPSGVRRGPVARLVEMERRKNEWLRQRFGR